MRVSVRIGTAVLALLLAVLPGGGEAKPFRFATTSDAATLDPHASNAAPTFFLLAQVYEGLVHRNDHLRLEPGLALRWEQVAPTRWRFWLREGVTFHDGGAFDAEDVVFSIRRGLAPTSDVAIYLDTVSHAEAVSPHIVDIVTRTPDAVIPDKLTRVMIMDRAWAEANEAREPQNLPAREDSVASRQANGTGPFMLRAREAGHRTVLARFPHWWGGPAAPNGVTEWHHVVIAADAARVAALLAGEVDFLHTVPGQEVARLQRDPRLKVLIGQENRTMWLGMDQARAQLLHANVRGRNPFRDVRVREAIAIAIDVEAIRSRVLRGNAVPTASMWTAFVTGHDEAFARRPPVDRERARRLLAEAGYPQGFEVTLDCPVGAYDESCEAIAGMLGQIGIAVRLNVSPLAVFLRRLQQQDVSFYALTWGVPTFDALYTLRGVMMTRALAGGGSWNAGGYSNPEVDRLIGEIERETDPARRVGLIRAAQRIHNAEYGHIPLYHLMVPYAMRAEVQMIHRADNLVFGRSVTFD